MHEYDELMSMFDALMLAKLDKENTDALTEFINDGINSIYNRFDSDAEIHPETLNILIRAIQVYNHNHENPYHFPTYENEYDPNDPTVMFMNHIVRRAAQREKLFDRTRGAYTKAQLEAQRDASQKKKETNMEEVDGGAKRKRTKRRHKRKQRKQRKSKRVKK